MNINEWYAEKCDVITPAITFQRAKKDYWWKLGGKAMSFEWSIQDPRCREIIRERFNINTNKMLSGKWICGATPYGGEFIGKTIAEAELACLQAIYEAEK